MAMNSPHPNQFVERSAPTLNIAGNERVVDVGTGISSVAALPEEEEKYSSYFSSILNLINSMIGAGLLALPRGFAAVGLVLGLLLAIIACCLSTFSFYLVALLCEELKGRNNSFTKSCEKFLPASKVFAEFFIAFLGIGAQTSYLILIGSTMPTISTVLVSIGGGQPAPIVLNRTFWISIYFFFVMFPLSFFKQLRSLRYASLVAVILIFSILFLIIACGILRVSDVASSGVDVLENLGVVTWNGTYKGFVECFSYMIYAYVCQPNMFSIVNEIREPKNVKRSTMVAVAATGVACFIYSGVGICGYLAIGAGATKDLFGDLRKDPFLSVMVKHDPNLISLALGQLAILLLVITCYAIIMIPTRNSCMVMYHSLVEFLSSIYKKYTLNAVQPVVPTEHTVPKIDAAKKERMERIISTCVIALATYFISLGVSDFGSIVSLVGAFSSNFIGFIFPPLLVLKMNRGKPWTLTDVGCVLLLLFGLSFVIMAIVNEVIGA